MPLGIRLRLVLPPNPSSRGRSSSTRKYATAHHWYALMLAALGRFGGGADRDPPRPRARSLFWSHSNQSRAGCSPTRASTTARSKRANGPSRRTPSSLGRISGSVPPMRRRERPGKRLPNTRRWQASGASTPLALFALGTGAQALAGPPLRGAPDHRGNEDYGDASVRLAGIHRDDFFDLGDKDQAFDWWAKACENRPTTCALPQGRSPGATTCGVTPLHGPAAQGGPPSVLPT